MILDIILLVTTKNIPLTQVYINIYISKENFSDKINLIYTSVVWKKIPVLGIEISQDNTDIYMYCIWAWSFKWISEKKLDSFMKEW